MARGSCLDCVRKHIAQASVLMDEALLGYPHHRWFAVGHLAEAESECRQEHPLFAEMLRAARLHIMSGKGEPNFDFLIRWACKLADGEASPDLDNHSANSKGFEPIDDITLDDMVRFTHPPQSAFQSHKEMTP